MANRYGSSGARGQTRRWILEGAIGVTALVAGLIFLREGAIVDAVVARDLGLVATLRGQSPSALRLAAEQAFADRRIDSARSLSAAAIARRPLDTRALRTLALAEEAAGAPAPALDIMHLAAQLSWRDLSTQTWLLRQALVAGDAEAAVQRADAVLRRDLLQPQMIAVLGQIALTPEGRGAIAAHLADRPAWRDAFLASLDARQPAVASANVALLQTMMKTEARPMPEESARLLERLIDRGYGAAAADLWAGITPQRPAPGGNLIDDPDFTRSADMFREGVHRSPFAWATTPQSDLAVSTGTSDSGRPGLIITENGGGGGDIVYRQVAVKPGRYRLTYVADAADPAARGRLQPRLQCMPNYHPIELAEAPRTASGRTAPSSFAFVAPAECPTVRLTFAARPADAPLATTFHLSDIAVRPF